MRGSTHVAEQNRWLLCGHKTTGGFFLKVGRERVHGPVSPFALAVDSPR